MAPNVSRPVTITLPPTEAVVAESVTAWPGESLVHVFIGPVLVLAMDIRMAEDLADALVSVLSADGVVTR